MKNRFAFLLLMLINCIASAQPMIQTSTTNYSAKDKLVSVSGTLTDLITSQNISGATVKINKRVIEILPDGMSNMKPINEIIDLNLETKSDVNGKFVLNVPVGSDNRKNYFIISIKKNGYEETGVTFLRIDNSQDIMSGLNFEMVRKELTTAEQEIVAKKLEEEKNKMELQKQSDPQPIAVYADSTKSNQPPQKKNSVSEGLQKNSQGACSWTVPTQIYVQNLYNGYNNTTCSNSGFYTGFMNFDDYIAGVVRGEVNGFPLEAMKAQAVAARSYSLKKHEVGQPVNCGQAYSNLTCANCTTAANATSQEIITYNNNSVSANYAARCNGNYTQHSEMGTWNPGANCNQSGGVIPWQRSKPCSGHNNCSSTSETPCCFTTISTANTGGYIYGHGVGLCQRGAQGFANNGLDYCTILNNFYTGICIANTTCTGGTLNCAGAIPLTCGQNYTSTTVGGNANVSNYSCNSWVDSGPEIVHTITTTSTGTITATLSGLGGIDLDVWILGSCDPTNCLGTVLSNSATYTNAPAGTYYIVVDGYLGASGNYTLNVTGNCGGVNLPDLTITSGTQSVSSTNVIAGSYITAYASEDNSGFATSGSNMVTLWLSVDGTLNTCADTYVGAITGYPNLSPGSNSIVLNASFQIPCSTSNGNYYLFFWADGCSTACCTGGIVAESNESNNFASLQLNIAANNLSVSANSTNATCNAACNGTLSANASGGSGSYSYSWSGGLGAGQTKTNVCAGTYTVTVTDGNGCTNTSTATITQPSQINVSASSTNVTCFGLCNGTLTANANGGSGSYTYTWSGGLGTGQTITNVCAGTYTVTITDGNGCTNTATATVTQPSQINASASSTNVTCFGLCNGTLTANANGGAGSYTYTWSGGLGTGQTITNVCAGTYTVTVTDGNGCTNTATTTITQPSIISPSASPTNVTCFNACDGTLSIIANGGTSPYTYYWSNGQTTPTIINLCAGIYTATITDAGGCTATVTASVTQPALLSVTATFNNPSCSSCLDGSATANPTGGTPPYLYQWSSGQTSQTASGLNNGVYTVTVTDANGCTSNTSVSFSVGINETSEQNDFSVFPNPTQEIINIKGDGISNGNYKLILTNTLGQQLRSISVKVFNHTIETKLNIKELARGIYFLNITSEHSKEIFKVRKL